LVKVITISGKAKHGKDSAANIIKDNLSEGGANVIIIHFADYLKYVCKQYFGWNGEKDEEGRTILQYIGTDIVRKKYPNFWADTVIRLINAICDDDCCVIIPDCRFKNEVFAMKDNFNSVSVNVIRKNFDNGLTEEQKNHPSERDLDNFHFDYVIESESGLDKLYVEVNKFLEEYKILNKGE